MRYEDIKRIAKDRDKACSPYKLDDIQMSEDGMAFLEMCFEKIDLLLDVVDAARGIICTQGYDCGMEGKEELLEALRKLDEEGRG